MRTSLFGVAFALASALSCAAPGGSGTEQATDAIRDSRPDAAVERVVLISVAGLRPGHYGAGGGGIVRTAGVEMPNVAALAARGAYANAMTPVLPSSPYPVHATLVTGRLPIHHGVLGDELIGPNGLYVRGIQRQSRIRGVPVWRAAGAAGKTTVSLNWPLSFGADVDLLLPDMGVPDTQPEQTWFELMEGEASPWILDQLKLMDGKIPNVVWPSTILRDEITGRLSCRIAAQPVTPALWLLAFEQSGAGLSLDGPGSDGGRLGLARVDAAIGRLVDCFERNGLLESTAFVIVGDRAIQPIHSIVSPNVVLEQAGLITRAPMQLGKGIASWDAFARSYGGAAVVYASEEESALLARETLREHAQRTRAFRIISATALARLNADENAWFGLEGEAGFGIGKSANGEILQATQRRGLGGYLPSSPGSEVGFVAWGAGVRSGVRVDRMSQVDVAPTVASLLGIALPSSDGSPVDAALGSRGPRP